MASQPLYTYDLHLYDLFSQDKVNVYNLNLFSCKSLLYCLTWLHKTFAQEKKSSIENV